MYHQWKLKQYIIYILLTLVFLSSWTDINGIYAELPQIVLTQPEHWKLGAYLALITNVWYVIYFHRLSSPVFTDHHCTSSH